MMPHTPGPWKAAYYLNPDDGLYSSISGPDNAIVVDPIDGDGAAFMRIDDQDCRLIAQAPEMYELLKEIEWSKVDCRDGSIVVCPSCNNLECFGHEPDCRLAAVLKAVEGEECQSPSTTD